PAPSARRLLMTIGSAYGVVAALMADEIRGLTEKSRDVETALREADDAVLVLAGPGGDDAVANTARTVVDTAAALGDSIGGLGSAGEPDPAIAQEYRAFGESLRTRLDAIAAELAGGGPSSPRRPDATLDDFVDACNRLRQGAIDGDIEYSRVSAVAQL